MLERRVVAEEPDTPRIVVVQVHVWRPVLPENGGQPRGCQDVLDVPLMARPLAHDEMAGAERSEGVDGGRHDARVSIDDAGGVVFDEIWFEQDRLAAAGQVEKAPTPAHHRARR